MDLIELYTYFAQFAPKDALKRNYIKGDKDTGEAVINTETTTIAGNARRISTINEYLFLGDSDFVLQRLRNSKNQLLLVDCDRIDYSPGTDDGVVYHMGVSVLEHYNRSNTDVLSELTTENRCLTTLRTILKYLSSDSENSCLLGLHLSSDFEIRFLDVKTMNGLIGYTAFFTMTESD